MYANNPLVLELIALLKAFGIKKVVISPGSRHRPLVASLENDSYFELFSVVDERSAAFFALGLIQECNEAVAITCSSGTACINYGSAVIEAYYQRLPLLVISSDRNPYFLNQGEDQMYAQSSTFADFTKYHAQLPIINNELDKWYANRLINEGLIALRSHGKGPVHLNLPVDAHHGDSITVPVLPKVRKITHNIYSRSLDWSGFVGRLKDKRVAVVWGQSVNSSERLLSAVNVFLSKTGGILLTDKMSNCHSQYAITNTLLVLKTIKPSEYESLMPDIVISIGGNYIFNNELKNFFRQGTIENWRVGLEDKVCDPFRHLTEMFEMEEADFFEAVSVNINSEAIEGYREQWLQFSDLPVPSLEQYNELYPIGKLLYALPENSDLQLANSNTIRFANYFPIKDSIRVNCNRGVNGIDGSMSTAVGFSSINDRPTFYITGELSFFYDMNALWIKHRSRQLRILLVNNNGGAVMYDLSSRPTDNKYPVYLATGHDAIAKGWAETQGFKYIAAHNKAEVDEGIQQMVDLNQDTPILLEVFTDYNDDGTAASEYFSTLDRRTFSEKVQGKLSRVAHRILKK